MKHRGGRAKTNQKTTFPSFEKKTIREANLWRKRIIHYVKMTQGIDLKTMTNDKYITENYRNEDYVDFKIKDMSIWVLGEHNASHKAEI